MSFPSCFCWRPVEPEVRAAEETPGFVGISMPTKSSERWINDGENMVKEFEKLGYKTDLQYGEDVVENQIAQIENMITKGVDVLVIAAIDGESLTNVLQKANDQGIEVISYDRLIRNSEHVSYYATFDNFKVGVLQGSYIEEKLGLKDGKRSVQHRIVRRFPGRQQRVLLLRRRHVGPAAVHRFRTTGGEERPDRI